jgi:glycosyltransferase involved in cell wall biosynthesis
VPFFWWGKQVVTIHDLIKHQSRGVKTTTKWPLIYWFKYLNYRVLIWLVVKRAAKILVPSQWTKTELTRRYRLPSEKIKVTYEGVDDKFKMSTAWDSRGMGNLLTKYRIKKPFVIYTGSLYPHKNVVNLVRAVQKINLKLVVVCSRNVFWQRFKKKIRMLKTEKLVTLTGFIPDKDLVTLYQQAEAFVFPSLLEGFGLPGLEAMAVGLPVLAANASCLPEVYGQAAVYFNPLDVEEMARKIKKVVGNKELKSKMVKLGYQQVKKYSWQKMARETIETYESCVSI